MKIRACLLSAALLVAPMATAQTVEVGELDDADPFSAGVLDVRSGGLDANAWSGTSARLATRLVERLPTAFENPIAEDLAEAALLSGAVPPEGTDAERAAFTRARSDYLLRSGRADVAAALAERDLGLARDRVFQTELALDRGDTDAACLTAQDIVEGRAEPYWAKLRAFCFARSGNVAGAELTAELLAETGYEDAVFTQLLDGLTKGRNVRSVDATTSLHRAMASELGLRREDAGDELASLLSRMGRDPVERLAPAIRAFAGEAVLLTPLELRDDLSDAATAALYVLAVETGDGEALADFLTRAEAKGYLPGVATHLETQIRSVTPSQDGVDVFTRAAVLRGDIGALVGIFGALTPDTEDADRVALVSDALGGAFRFAPLGEDIEARLAEGSERALRDALIAMALGGRPTDAAVLTLEDADYPEAQLSPGSRLALRAAGNEGARAETALRASIALAGGELDARSLADIVAALDAAGLNSFANRVAAWDFAQGL